MKTIRRRFETMQDAQIYAQDVNRILRRKAAIVAEISGVDWSDRPERWNGNLDSVTKVKYYEVTFTTKSSKF